MNEESTKNDLDLGIGNNFTIVGDRILIKLDEALDHTSTESGILIPLNEVYETEGGKMRTRTSERKHLAIGTVLQIAPLAAKNLETTLTTLNVGDRVYISPTALTKSFYFFPDRSKLVQDFNGYICVPHTMIEAKSN